MPSVSFVIDKTSDVGVAATTNNPSESRDLAMTSEVVSDGK